MPLVNRHTPGADLVAATDADKVGGRLAINDSHHAEPRVGRPHCLRDRFKLLLASTIAKAVPLLNAGPPQGGLVFAP